MTSDVVIWMIDVKLNIYSVKLPSPFRPIIRIYLQPINRHRSLFPEVDIDKTQPGGIAHQLERAVKS